MIHKFPEPRATVLCRPSFAGRRYGEEPKRCVHFFKFAVTGRIGNIAATFCPSGTKLINQLISAIGSISATTRVPGATLAVRGGLYVAAQDQQQAEEAPLPINLNKEIPPSSKFALKQVISASGLFSRAGLFLEVLESPLFYFHRLLEVVLRKKLRNNNP